MHSGTLGWLTLTIVAGSAWLLGGIDRRLALALAVTIPVYVAAFYSGNLPLRAITGVLLLAVIAWLVVWAWQAYRGGERTLPRLFVVVGLTVFAAGSLLGVILQISFAMGSTILPGDVEKLEAMGVRKVFGVDTPLQEIVEAIRDAVAEKAGRA